MSQRLASVVALLLLPLIACVAIAESPTLEPESTAKSRPADGESFPNSLVKAELIPTYTAMHTASPLKIDGKLDEKAWTSAAKTPSFVDLISGHETEHETHAAVLWDEEFLYVGFWVDEPNVDARFKRRDSPVYRDNDVELFIAGKDAYYELEVNAYGTLYEGFFVWQDAYEAGGYANDPQLRLDAPKAQRFDGVGFRNHPRGKRLAFLNYDLPGLQSAVHVEGTLNDRSDTDQGWTVELALPWESMQWLAQGDARSIPPQPIDQWRMNLFRFNKYKTRSPGRDSGGWALGQHGVWDSHIPEVFPKVIFAQE